MLRWISGHHHFLQNLCHKEVPGVDNWCYLQIVEHDLLTNSMKLEVPSFIGCK